MCVGNPAEIDENLKYSLCERTCGCVYEREREREREREIKQINRQAEKQINRQIKETKIILTPIPNH